MQPGNTPKRRLTMPLILGAITSFSAFALGTDEVHPVLARYPTAAQLQQRIDEAKRLDAAAYHLAMTDFGDAIRVSRYLSGPPWPGKSSAGRPHVTHGPVLSELRTPDMWAMSFRKADEIEPGSEWVRFYRAHLDELTLDESSPQLELVLIDVVLNGWHDWDDWSHEKLAELREKFPELHRVYAIRELRRLKTKEIAGVLLELVRHHDIAPELFLPVREGVKDLVKPEDSFEFVLDVYLKSNDPVIRTRMEHFIPPFSARAGKGGPVKEIWRPFLESEIPLLRFEASKAFDLAIPDVFTCYHIHEQWVAENDPDPDRREKARKNVRNREAREERRRLQLQKP